MTYNSELIKKYSCENGHVHTRQELKREMDFGYDQLCCPVCNDVMFDELHGHQHCIEVNDLTNNKEKSSSQNQANK